MVKIFLSDCNHKLATYSYGHNIMAGYFKPCYRFLFIKDCVTTAQMLLLNSCCCAETGSTSVLWQWAADGNAAVSAEGA